MKHARFAPSSLSRTIICPGSIKLCESLPEPPESPYAAEGTLLHEYAKMAVDCHYHEYTGSESGPSWLEYTRETGMTPEHEVLIKDTLSALEERILVPFVRNGRCKIVQDIRVHMNDDVNGTLDLAVETAESIHIIDFKFGSGVSVDPDNNPQLLAYLIGYLNEIQAPVTPGSIDAIEDRELYVWIFQPRLDKFEGVRVFKDELEYFKARVDKAIRLADSNYPPFRPGESQCRFCKGGAVCKARLKQVQEDALAVFAAHADLTTPSNWTCSNKELAEVLKSKGAVTAAFSAIEAHLYGELMMQKEVPGFKLVTGRGKREWASNVNIDTLSNLFPALDTEDLLKIELRSPAQVEKLLPAKQRKELDDLIVKIEGSPTLALESSAKEAINPVEKAFAEFVDPS